MAPTKEKWRHGRTVENGTLRFVSVSDIERMNVTSAKGGGCHLKWYYRKVLGWKEKQTERKGRDLGAECHEQIETYLTTGASTLGRIPSAARKYMPHPKSIGVTVELDLAPGDLDSAILKIADVPMVGKLDIVDRRGQYLDEDAAGFFKDPSGTVEILDWKFGGAKLGSKQPKCHALSGPELAQDVQMMSYALYPILAWGAPHVRLSHVYTNTQGTPTSSKASIRVTQDEVYAKLEFTKSLVRTMQDLASETDVTKVPGNAYACGSYGGCDYYDSCEWRKQNGGLTSFYGPTAQHQLLTGDIDMGIMDGLGLGSGLPGAPAFSVGNQLAALNPQPAAYTPAQPTQEFAQAITVINAKGYGFPNLAGQAAEAFLVLNGRPPTAAGATYKGFGTLAASGNAYGTIEHILGLAKECAGVPDNNPKEVPPGQATAPAQLGILNPTTPQSNPALAADPIPGMAQLPPPAGAGAGAVTQIATLPTAPAQPGLPPAAEPKKRGRKPKAESAAGEVTTGHRIFIDCHPSTDATDLQGWIDDVAADLAKYHQVTEIRVTAGEHALAFGRWKGHLAAACRDRAPSLPAGDYTLTLGASEINAAAFEGLRAARSTDGTSLWDLAVTK